MKRFGFALLVWVVALLTLPFPSSASTVIDLIDDRVTLSGAVWTRSNYPGHFDTASFAHSYKALTTSRNLSVVEEIVFRVPDYFDGVPVEESISRFAYTSIGSSFCDDGFSIYGISATDQSPNASDFIGGIAVIELNWNFRVFGNNDFLFLRTEASEGGDIWVNYFDETENTTLSRMSQNDGIQLSLIDGHQYRLQIRAMADSSDGLGDPGPNFELTSSAIVTPEPGAWLLFAGGLPGVILCRRNLGSGRKGREVDL